MMTRSILITVLVVLMVAQVVADDYGVLSVPVVIADSPPTTVQTQFHATFVFGYSIHKTQISIGAVQCCVCKDGEQNTKAIHLKEIIT